RPSTTASIRSTSKYSPRERYLILSRSTPLGHQLLDLRNGVVHGDVRERLADSLRRRMRIACEAVVDPWRSIGILTALSALPSSLPAPCRVAGGLPRHALIACGFPLLWRLTRRVERNCLVGGPDVHPRCRLHVEHLGCFHHRAVSTDRQLVLVQIHVHIVVRLVVEVADVVDAHGLRRDLLSHFRGRLSTSLLPA